jgi:hypothetical protein
VKRVFLRTSHFKPTAVLVKDILFVKISRVLTEKITIDDFLFCAAKNKFE